MSVAAIYENDFYAWLTSNAQLLRERKIAEIDVDHLVEELESMGKSEKRALMSRFALLLAHLLTWQFQPAKRSRSWKNTILTQRLDIHELLEESPSLRYDLAEKLANAYEKAKLNAEIETGIEAQHFPPSCPFTLEQLLDNDFFPSET